MRNISIIVPSLTGGGAEFVAHSWARQLSEMGYQVELVLTKAEPAVENYSPSNDKFKITPISFEGRSYLAEAWSLFRYLWRSEVDIALSLMTRANFQLLLMSRVFLRRKSFRVFISERNMPYSSPGSWTPRSWTRTLAQRILYPKSDGLIAISHPVGAAFRDVAGEPLRGRVRVVPNPALSKITDSPQSVRIAPRTSQISLIVPARLVEKKRPLLALEVADRLFEAGRLADLRFFGRGPLAHDLLRIERPYPVRMEGHSDHWFDNLTDSSLVLLTSAVEGFANVLLEAAATGVPSVAASNAYGVADAIVPGVTGDLALSQDVKGFVEAIERASTIDSIVPASWLRRFTISGSTELLEKVLLEKSMER